jgi:hypothetical protein
MPSGLVFERAIKAIGVEFSDENGGGPGVRPRKRGHRARGSDAFRNYFDGIRYKSDQIAAPPNVAMRNLQ